MDWDAWEKQTGQKRPAYIDGVGNVNYSYGSSGPDRANSDGERNALQNWTRVEPAGMRQGMMPAPQMPATWRASGPGLAWLQAGANLRPR